MDLSAELIDYRCGAEIDRCKDRKQREESDDHTLYGVVFFGNGALRRAY